MRNHFSKREIALVCIILLLLSIIIYSSLYSAVINNIDIANSVFTIFTAVVCSVLAAAIAPYSMQNNGISKEELKQVLHEQNSELTTNMKSIVDEKDFAIPSITYHDTDDPNISFDKKLNESISVTKKYIYFSDRALYLPKRLSKMIQTVDERLCITVLLADIREKTIYDARADLYLQRERAKHAKDPTYKIKEVEEVIKEEKIAVLKSIYALSKLKERYNIEIYLHKEIPFLRFEITENLLILTFLTQLATGKTYPASVIYENEKLFRVNFEDYSKEIVKRSHHLESNEQTIDALKELAKQANLPNITDTDITDYYENKVK